jgi:hypothetical protein
MQKLEVKNALESLNAEEDDLDLILRFILSLCSSHEDVVKRLNPNQHAFREDSQSHEIKNRECVAL